MGWTQAPSGRAGTPGRRYDPARGGDSRQARTVFLPPARQIQINERYAGPASLRPERGSSCQSSSDGPLRHGGERASTAGSGAQLACHREILHGAAGEPTCSSLDTVNHRGVKTTLIGWGPPGVVDSVPVGQPQKAGISQPLSSGPPGWKTPFRSAAPAAKNQGTSTTAAPLHRRIATSHNPHTRQAPPKGVCLYGVSSTRSLRPPSFPTSAFGTGRAQDSL